MIILNQTPQNDNQAILLFRFLLDNGEAYLSTKSITLDTIYFDGEVLLKGSEVAIDEYFDCLDGGGISSHNAMNLYIINKSPNSAFNSFFNEFYPNNMNFLINRRVDIGIVWDNATSLSQITWLTSFVIIDYSYEQQLILSLSYASILDSASIPRYRIQNTINNGISYFPEYESKEFLDTVIPILYGDFPIETYVESDGTSCGWLKPSKSWVAAGTVNAGDRYYTNIIASHKVKELYKVPFLFNFTYSDGREYYPDTTNNNASTLPSLSIYVPDAEASVLINTLPNPFYDYDPRELRQYVFNNLSVAKYLSRHNIYQKNVVVGELSIFFSYGEYNGENLTQEQLNRLWNNDNTEYLPLLASSVSGIKNKVFLSRANEYSNEFDDNLSMGRVFLVITAFNPSETTQGALNVVFYSSPEQDTGVEAEGAIVIEPNTKITTIVRGSFELTSYEQLFNLVVKIENVNAAYPYSSSTETEIRLLEAYLVIKGIEISNLVRFYKKRPKRSEKNNIIAADNFLHSPSGRRY